MQTDSLDSAIARRFRLPHVPTLVSMVVPMSPVTISHVKCDEPEHGLTRTVPTEDAYVAQILVRELPSAELWLHGKKVPLAASPAGGLFLFSFQSDPVVRFHSPFEFVRFYISQHALDELTREGGGMPAGGLRRPDFGAHDRTLQHLGAAMLPALANPARANQLFVDYMALAFHAHLTARYPGTCRDSERARSGLASWQARRATEMIDAKLDGSLSIGHLASECCLSPSHFSRAFAQTFGVPPHRWLLERRIARAKQLIAGNRIPLSEVAVSCGFSTLSHFSRVFSLIAGATPSSWRRMTECRSPLDHVRDAQGPLARESAAMS